MFRRDPPDADASAPLEMTPDRMREAGYRVVDLLVERYANLRRQPAWRGATRAGLDARLAGPAPEAGSSFDDVLHRLVEDVLPFRAHVDHPRFMAFVPGAPTWPAVLGDFIAAGANIFQGTWLSSAGPSTIELVVMDWMRSWIGMPDSAGGLMLSGGSAANLTALACARAAVRPAHGDDLVVYCSTESHSSIHRAARIIGFADERIRVVPVDHDDRVSIDRLRDAIDADAATGLVPLAIVASAGTTSTGAIDPLHDLADVARRCGAWLHVDAAYGGFAVLTRRGRDALDGLHRADSIALDPHKWLFQPFEAGCLLVRDVALLESAFHVMPPYLQDTALPSSAGGPDTAASLPVNFANRGFQLSRSARALKVWLSIQTFGLAAFRDAIDLSLDLAVHAQRRIEREPALELLSPARLGIVCFRRRCGGDTAAHDDLNARLLHDLLASGAAMISSTRVHGAFALRLCILNYRTRQDDVDAILDWIAAARPDVPGA
jgi:aromatic-L-amino-acid/L-tryptophan decarboxylase